MSQLANISPHLFSIDRNIWHLHQPLAAYIINSLQGDEDGSSLDLQPSLLISRRCIELEMFTQLSLTINNFSHLGLLQMNWDYVNTG